MRRWLLPLVSATLCLLPVSGRSAMWVTGYYVGWRQNYLPPHEIDFKAITHLIHFAAHPRSDGTLDTAVNLLHRANVQAVVQAAHRAGKKVLVTVGGQSSRAEFEGAMSEAHRQVFIDNIVRFMQENGYDGVDIDMEEITADDGPAYARFIRELRSRLDRMSPRPLLTAAALWDPSLFARLAPKFDQINLMTYNLAGPYPGWVTWHNGPLYDGGYRFPNAQLPLPSVDGLVNSFIAAGVPREKLGIGLCFNGYVWSGGDVDRPRQTWTRAPSIRDMPYHALADAYHITEYDYTNPYYHWDPEAEASYLSIDGDKTGDRQFISYDNEVAVRRKVRYAREKGIGGVFVWELAGGYRRGLPEGRRDLLLKAVKQSAMTR